jgi:hypothetical protein
MPPTIDIIRPGDKSKPDPFTICIIANPALEAPRDSGIFIADPITGAQADFDSSVQYIIDSLFGTLPNQSEKLLADPSIAPYVRVVSVFDPGLSAQDSNSLVAKDHSSNLLIARRTVFGPFLARYGYQADVAYAISKTDFHTRASAWFTTDDDGRGGVSFTLDGVSYSHRFYNLIPGTIAMHSSSHGLTALHEFGHALSSYSNGKIVDLYVNSPAALNNKRGRPIPSDFVTYNGVTMASDTIRDGLGYPSSWQSYHCELNAAAFPAAMDDYWKAHDGIPVHCEHDRVTRQFLLDRLYAKIGR